MKKYLYAFLACFGVLVAFSFLTIGVEFTPFARILVLLTCLSFTWMSVMYWQKTKQDKTNEATTKTSHTSLSCGTCYLCISGNRESCNSVAIDTTKVDLDILDTDSTDKKLENEAENEKTINDNLKKKRKKLYRKSFLKNTVTIIFVVVISLFTLHNRSEIKNLQSEVLILEFEKFILEDKINILEQRLERRTNYLYSRISDIEFDIDLLFIP